MPNEHFGTTVNVSGLLTAHDIIASLNKMGEHFDGVLIPESALRSGEDIFLDDVTLDDLRAHFPKARIEPVQNGHDYRMALTGWRTYHKDRARETAYMWQSNAGYTKNVSY